MNHIDDLIDRLLSPDAPAQLRESADHHIRACARCRERFGSLLDMHDLMIADAAQNRSLQRSSVPHSPRHSRIPTWAVAALVLLALGMGYAGGARVGLPATTRAGGEYLLVLTGSDTGALSREERDEAVRRFRAWTDSLAARNALISQGQLAPGGTWVGAPGSARNEASGELLAMNGYFLIRADGAGEAAAIARTSPYLAMRGRILVRSIVR